MALTLANSAGNSASAGTARTVVYAAAPTSGNLLLMSLQWETDPGAYVTNTPTAAGYSEIETDVSGTACGSLWYRWADGTEPASEVITWTNSVACGMSLLEYTWTGSASDFDLSDESITNVSTSVKTSGTAAITPTVDNSVVFAVFNPSYGNGWDKAGSTYSNSFAEDYRRENNNPAVFVAQKDLSTAASTSTTFDNNNDVGSEIYNIIAAFREEAAGGGSTPKGPLGMPLHGPFGGPI